MGELILPSSGIIRVPEARNVEAQNVVKFLDRIVQVLPEGVVARQFCVAAVSEANSLTRPCDPKSVLMSAFNCATIGWIPGKALGHAFFVPFKGQCQLIPGYKGLLDLAFSNEFLTQCNTEVILDGEKYERWHDELGPHLRHELPRKRDLRRDKVVASYCTYRTKNGGYGIAFVDRSELDKVDKQKDVWRSDYIAMAKKTAILRASKQWRITNRLGLAVQLDEQAQRNEPQTAPPEFDDITGVSVQRPEPLDLSKIADQPPEDEPPIDAEYSSDYAARMQAAETLDALTAIREEQAADLAAGECSQAAFDADRTVFLARKVELGG